VCGCATLGAFSYCIYTYSIHSSSIYIYILVYIYTYIHDPRHALLLSLTRFTTLLDNSQVPGARGHSGRLSLTSTAYDYIYIYI
jgi:hypothetical protein